ncbi:hypothetical protein NQ318_003412 [Aromia moschata]|uniref:Uncharacterized protein n=1 Tax=Aromia moschata TaxID=1265417 RepID=A0AAV8YVZ5_9CUCU|nr:hypothetical protein NQ318_003412 [Aromia moschata]
MLIGIETNPYEFIMNGPKRSYTIPKSNLGRYNGKLKDILTSSRHKSEGKVIEPDVANIPLIKQTDNARLLPKYTTILAKSGGDGVSMDDLDQLQQDLEKLLSTSAVRIRFLLSDIGEIDRNDDIHDRKAHDKTSLKRKRPDEKPKFKDLKKWNTNSLIQEFSKEIDIKVPEIGEHYANTWSEELVIEEQNLGKLPTKKASGSPDTRKNGLQA